MRSWPIADDASNARQAILAELRQQCYICCAVALSSSADAAVAASMAAAAAAAVTLPAVGNLTSGFVPEHV